MTKESVTSEYLFENEYCYITASGELTQKDNPFFKGRVLCNLSEDEIEDKVREFTETFDELNKDITGALNELGESGSKDSDKELDKLLKKLKSADAIGDFESLVANIENHRSQPGAESGETKEEPADTKESKTPKKEKKPKAKSDESSPDEKEEKKEKKEEKKVEKAAKAKDKDKKEAEDGAANAVTKPGEEKEKKEDKIADEDYPEALRPFVELTLKAEEVAASADWQYGGMELDNLSHKWTELAAPEEEFQDRYEELNKRFQEAGNKFNDRKSQHYEQLKQKKQKNADRKKDLLDRFEKIIADKKWHASGEVRGIEKRWDKIRLGSGAEADEMEQKFRRLSELFEENRVEYLVKRKQKEEDNTNLKLLILDKIESLVNSIGKEQRDWEKIDSDYNEYLKEWKKVGRTPRDRSGEVWQRYRSIRSQFIEKKLENNDEYRNQIETNVRKKEDLCIKAEALLEAEDLATASKEINKLHKRWKETGPLPKEKSDELWERFKEASDKFNKKKSENIELLRQQEKENYEAKLKLCAKAEQIKDSDDWKSGTKAMQDLMDEWKKIGPVPRRKTHKVWKRFKKIMDEFYDRKRSHYKDVRDDQKENLKKKRELIDKIKELGNHEDAQEAVKLVKPLQEEFNKIGFVPIKNKNRVYKQFREACDIVYQRARAEKTGKAYAPSGNKLSSDALMLLKRKHGELSRLRKECDELRETVLKYSDTQTFIKPNKKGNQLRDEIQAKIDEASAKLEDKLNKLEDVQQEIDNIKAHAQDE